jgi:hypothetical protein
MNKEPQPTPAPIMWKSEDEEPTLKISWVNNEVKPALITDAETGKKVAAYSFARGDALRVIKPEAIGKCRRCTLPLYGYSYDSQQNLYAITAGTMPVKFRNAETETGGREVLFRRLPETIQEYCIQDFTDVFTLVRFNSEYNPKTKQVLINFNDKAA